MSEFELIVFELVSYVMVVSGYHRKMNWNTHLSGSWMDWRTHERLQDLASVWPSVK